MQKNFMVKGLFWVIAICIFSACRKADINLGPNTGKSKEAFFKLTGIVDKEIIKVADDLKRQESFINYLPSFIKKNGVPRWDKVFYKVSQSRKDKDIKQATPTAARETVENSGTQGMFFIPLQSPDDNTI